MCARFLYYFIFFTVHFLPHFCPRDTDQKISITNQLDVTYNTICYTYLFGTGNKLLQLIMQRFQQTFTLFILTTETGQHNRQERLVTQQWRTTMKPYQHLTHQPCPNVNKWLTDYHAGQVVRQRS